MPELTTSQTLDAPADAVWALLEDFAAIERWWPKDGPIQIESVTIDGGGLGMVRQILNKGAAHAIDERLDFLDRDARRLVLSIVGQRPAGLRGYLAEGQVVDLGDGRCRLDYRVLYTTAPGLEEKTKRGLLATYAMMFRGLEAAARTGQRG
jgi:uncharacterized protein YndB with AHSA1/START domain